MPARRGIVLLLIHFIIIGRVSVKGFFINSDDDFEDQSSSYSVENINPEKLSNALKALMSLNDGELGLLLSGAAIPDVASQINPMTSFLLANSHQKLETIQDAIARYPDSQLPGDLAIAKRRKLSENRLQPDSLLAALAQLASQVKEQQRAEIPVPQQGPIFTSNSSREIAKSRRRRSHRNGSKAGYYTAQQHFHPEFFYRPESEYLIKKKKNKNYFCLLKEMPEILNPVCSSYQMFKI